MKTNLCRSLITHYASCITAAGAIAFAVEAATAQNLYVPVYNLVSQQVAGRRVTLTLLEAGAVTSGPWLIAGDSVALYTGTNGTVTFSNVLAGGYELTIAGNPSRVFALGMPDTNGTVNAVACIGSTNIWPYYYSAAQLAAFGVPPFASAITNFEQDVTLPGAFLDDPSLTNAVNYGSPFSSPGTYQNSEEFGANSFAGQIGAQAFGNGCQAIGTNSCALGAGAGAAGFNSVAMGAGADALADNSVAIGNNAEAHFGLPNSSAIGYGAQTTASNQIMLGGPLISTIVQSNLSVLNGTINGNGSGLSNLNVTSGIATLNGIGTNMTIHGGMVIGTNINFPVAGTNLVNSQWIIISNGNIIVPAFNGSPNNGISNPLQGSGNNGNPGIAFVNTNGVVEAVISVQANHDGQDKAEIQLIGNSSIATVPNVNGAGVEQHGTTGGSGDNINVQYSVAGLPGTSDGLTGTNVGHSHALGFAARFSATNSANTVTNTYICLPGIVGVGTSLTNVDANGGWTGAGELWFYALVPQYSYPNNTNLPVWKQHTNSVDFSQCSTILTNIIGQDGNTYAFINTNTTSIADGLYFPSNTFVVNATQNPIFSAKPTAHDYTTALVQIGNGANAVDFYGYDNGGGTVFTIGYDGNAFREFGLRIMGSGAQGQGTSYDPASWTTLEVDGNAWATNSLTVGPVGGGAKYTAITNNGMVWYAVQTNATPTWLSAPMGSLCTTTNGNLYMQSNGWNKVF